MRTGIKGSGRRAATAAMAMLLLGSAVLAGPAFAQDSPSPDGPEAAPAWQTQAVPDHDGPCRVFAFDAPGGDVKDLRAGCGGHGLILGPVTSFEAIANEALQATLVDMHLGSSRRVVLLTMPADGQPLLEDLTGQLALAAGRGPMSELEGVELDLKAFARTGEVGVRGRPQDAGSRKAGKVGLARQIALTRARLSGRPAQHQD